MWRQTPTSTCLTRRGRTSPIPAWSLGVGRRRSCGNAPLPSCRSECARGSPRRSPMSSRWLTGLSHQILLGRRSRIANIRIAMEPRSPANLLSLLTFPRWKVDNGPHTCSGHPSRKGIRTRWNRKAVRGHWRRIRSSSSTLNACCARRMRSSC